MRVLAVSDLYPLPTDFGSAVRVLDTMRALAEAHELHVLTASRGGSPREEAERLAEAVGASVEVFAGKRFGERLKPFRWARALFTMTPTWIGGNLAPRLARRLSEIAPGYERVVFLTDYSVVYLDVLKAALGSFPPIVMDKHNVMGISIAAGHIGGRLGVLRRGFDVSAVRRFEERAFNRASAVVVTSDDEAARAVELYGCRSPSIVRSGVGLPREAWRPPGSKVVLCVGNFYYGPNREGILRFIEKGWLSLEARAELDLVGRAPEEVEALAGRQGIRVHGFVPDLQAVIAASAVGLAPLWAGAGVKLKTLTMLAAGMPVVATPIALEGIDAVDGVHCLVGSTPEELADLVARVLDDQLLASSLGSSGRSMVQDRYTWSSLGRQFASVVEHLGPPPSGEADRRTGSPDR